MVTIKQKYFFALERVKNAKKHRELAKEYVQLKRAKAAAVLARKNKVLDRLKKQVEAKKIAL